ncbi:sigma factor, partial [Acinetobacter baumannii]
MVNEKEFIHLINQHQRIIYKVCNLYMQSHADRDDLFQEITLQAWKAYANFRGDSKFST